MNFAASVVKRLEISAYRLVDLSMFVLVVLPQLVNPLNILTIRHQFRNLLSEELNLIRWKRNGAIVLLAYAATPRSKSFWNLF